VASAIASTTAPGRIQLVARRPATIVDVAHTEGSFRRLLDVLETSFAWDRLCLVLGFSADKNISAMLRAIAEWSQALGGKRKGCEVTACFTRADNPRAAAPEALAEEAGRAGLINVSCEPDPVWAFESCRERSGEGGLVCVAGSFYLAGRIMEHLGVEP